MSQLVDAGGDGREVAVAKAAAALRRGELVVLPTDTVYGVAADAFAPAATRRVFAAKRRSRRYPLPVLLRSQQQVPALVQRVPEAAERLMAAYWPGPLSIVVATQPGLVWDIGDNEDTVAIRMPLDTVTLDVIREIGPLAVTSANRSGQPPATSAAAARDQLGDEVAVYVDDGPRTEGSPSTIVDLTRSEPLLIRDGDLPPDEVLAVARGELDPDAVGAPDGAPPTDPKEEA